MTIRIIHSITITDIKEKCNLCEVCTFGDIVSQEAVVDLWALSVFGHLKQRERHLSAPPSCPCSLCPPSLHPCCSRLAGRHGARHSGTAAKPQQDRETDRETGETEREKGGDIEREKGEKRERRREERGRERER